MPTRLTIGIGQTLVVRDGKHENMKVLEGRINSIQQISGTSNYEVNCEGPFTVDVEVS